MTTKRPDEEYESEFGTRLDAYAEDGVAPSPTSDVGAFMNRGGRAPWFARLRSSGAMAATAALAVIVVSAGLAFIGPGLDLGKKPSGTPTPSGSTAPSLTASIQPTPQPSLTGETPAPGNAAPSGATYIPNLTIDQVLAAAQHAGFSCVSEPESESSGATFYQLICSLDDAASGYSFAVTAGYWTFDRIDQLHLVANPLGGTQDPSKARSALSSLFVIALQVADRQAAVSWFTSNENDPACDPCVQTYTDYTIELQGSAIAGSGAITVHGKAVVP
jgi:hypothetical protein